MKANTNLGYIGTNPVDDPFTRSGNDTGEGGYRIRRCFGAQHLSSEKIRLTEKCCAPSVEVISESLQPHVPRSSRVLPLPSLPQTRVNSPLGKTILRSINMNFIFGVDDALDAVLAVAVPERARSCGHVTVAPWNAIGEDFAPSGGTGATSAA